MFYNPLQQGEISRAPLPIHDKSYQLIWNGFSKLRDYWPRIALALVILALFYYLGKFIRRLIKEFVNRYFKRDKSPEIAEMLSTLLYFFFLLSGISLALEILEMGDTLTRLLASAGILGIVAGFAFKDIASNLFAGLLLKYQKPFQVDDWIEVATHFGKVEQMGGLTTDIRLIGGEQVYVPNRLIYEQALTNYTSGGMRLIRFKTGVAYGEDLARVKAVTLEEAAQVEGVLKNRKIDFYYTQIGDFAYQFELHFWIAYHSQRDYLKATSDIIMRIHSRFKKEAISIAYPVTTLDFGVKGGKNIFDAPLQVEALEKPQSSMRSSKTSDSGAD